MADFIRQDDVEQAGGFMIAALNQFFLDRRRGTETACFEQAWHQRHPCKHIVGGALGHVPKTGVGRAVAVIAAERLQTLAQNGEVADLFGGDADPVGVNGSGMRRKRVAWSRAGLTAENSI